MEMTYLIIGCIAGGITGAIVAYFALKSSMVSRNSYDDLNSVYIKSQSDLENSQLKIQEFIQNTNTEKELIQQQSDLMSDLKNELAKICLLYTSPSPRD